MKDSPRLCDIGYATLMKWRTSVLNLQLVTDINLKGLGCCGAAWLAMSRILLPPL